MRDRSARTLLMALITVGLASGCFASIDRGATPEPEIPPEAIPFQVGEVQVEVDSARVTQSYSTHYIMRYPPEGRLFYELMLNIDGLPEPQDALAWAEENLHLAAAGTYPDLYHSGWFIVGQDIEYRVGADFDYRYVLMFAVPVDGAFEEYRLELPDGRAVALDAMLQISVADARTRLEAALGAALSGRDNHALGPFSTIGGGLDNAAVASHATVAGGQLNQATASHAVVAGGRENEATYFYAAVCGGYGNLAQGRDATVAGGSRNNAQGTHASVGGGIQNEALGTDAHVGGGSYNRAARIYSAVSGGTRNLTRGYAAYIGGGSGNAASGDHSVVTGGLANEASGNYAGAGGGYSNLITGDYASVPGGAQNHAEGDFSVAMGRGAQIQASHDGAFVFSDSTEGPFRSASANEFAARATGGVRFVTTVGPSGGLLGGVMLPEGAGSWSMASSRELKTDLETVDVWAILHALADLQLYRWRYRAQEAPVTHLGPMAEDFSAAFGLGVDEDYIDSIDADGVALAAIQALHRELLETDARLDRQSAEIADLQNWLTELQRSREPAVGSAALASAWVMGIMILALQAIRVRM